MSNWFEGDVSANGIKVHYHRTGTPGKPVLLLLHGITDSGRVWVRVARELEDEYDMVMTDARGHGQSDDLASGFSIPMLADDAAGVIGGLGLERHFGSFQGYPWREVLARIECPTLLVTGNPEAGAIVTPEVAQEAVALLKKG